MAAEQDPTEFPEGGIWTHAQWADRVNRGLEQTIVFVPNDTIPLGINGVTYYVEAGKEIELPLPFFYLYQESQRARGQIMEHALGSLEKRSFGPGQFSVTNGWNGNVLE